MRARRSSGHAALLIAAVLAAPAGAALAGKPGGGGGGGTPPGSIYFSPDDGWLGPSSILVMDGAGGHVATLATSVPGDQRLAASRLRHGGRRWFLKTEPVVGEAGFGGLPRFDVYAVREDGAVHVRLTGDPTLDCARGARTAWTPDESAVGATISFAARRWTGASAGDTVVAGTAGLYTAHVAFDAAGDVVGLDAEPSFRVSLGTYVQNGNEAVDARAVAWSPDMTRGVCDRFSSGADIRVVDVATGASTVIASGGVEECDWSPDGSRIAFVGQAFTHPDPYPSIYVVSPTGASRTLIFQSAKSGPVNLDSLTGLRWSSDSAQVAFEWQKSGSWYQSIYRVAATGGTAVRLRSDPAKNLCIADWR